MISEEISMNRLTSPSAHTVRGMRGSCRGEAGAIMPRLCAVAASHVMLGHGRLCEAAKPI